MQLVKYEEARRALQICATVDEAKGILDKVAALQAYAKQQNDSDMEVWLAEMKLRARRRIGEISLELEASKGGANPKATLPSGGTSKTETLNQAGISTSNANRCEKVAGIEEKEFERVIEEAKEQSKPVTYDQIERECINNKPHISHNSGENEWYTPEKYILAAKEAMGGIDLDPASSEKANETVGASIFYSESDNGLDKEWKGNVWLNPPYGQPLIKEFSKKLCESVEDKDITQACVLINNATETEWFQAMASKMTACCFLKGRIKFNDETGTPKNTPLQGQAILYYGRQAEQFQKVFSGFGFVVFPQ